MTTFDFNNSGCAWCHPGGGVAEYDRDGYRLDSLTGLFQTGANPEKKISDYFLFGIQAGNDASPFAGAGFFEVTATTGVFSPDQVINQGTLKKVYDSASGTYKTVGKKYNTTTAGGASEVDCLMCHFSQQFANLERNYAFPAATAPKLGASLGLVGAGVGERGLLDIATKGQPGVNPNPSPATWLGWNDTIISGLLIKGAPKRENCAICHFPDKSMVPPPATEDLNGDGKIDATDACLATPSKCGPSTRPLGYTAFQKYMAPGTTFDGDEIPGVNGKDGNNDAAWNAVKGRVEGGKRGESLNDPLNPDAHMKSSVGAGMTCSLCHYTLSGSFEALTDASGNVIQPAVDVLKIDHQFAKGDNTPDGKNMDQLDNTVTCESCHISKTHPNTYLAPYPEKAHAAFPAVHFQKISCKTCHIPILNGPMDQDVADFLVGPFQTFERTQTTQVAAGVSRRPLYLWRQTEHGKGHLEIQPFGIMAVAVWANAGSLCDPATDPTCNLGECGSITPTYQRLGKKSAEMLRTHYGDANNDGVYDWTLNRAQGGDTSLIVNKSSEITDFITQLGLAGGPANPVMHFYFNQFAISHNVRPLSAASNRILGSKAGGGCLMCHSSSNPASPTYSTYSVGFFDKTYDLFKQPVDGGQGLVQTAIDAQAPLSGTLERVNIKFPYKKADGSSSVVNLSNAPGQAVGNRVNQADVLGYDATRLAAMTNPDTASFTIAASAGPNGTISDAGATRVLGLTDKTYTITAAPGYRVASVVVDGISRGAITSYTFSSVSADHIIEASFVSDAYTITAYASLYGSISPSGLVSVNKGSDATFTCNPDTGRILNVVYVDGRPVSPVSPSYTFTNVQANHQIKCYFK